MMNPDAGPGRVILVGAGCGPADLITLRGLRALRSADAVVYDALIDPDLLQYVRPDALCIAAGKRSGRHSIAQGEIHTLLIRLAGEGKTICRLKGGDPFVFGRGGEEVEALRAAGIPVTEIPGISSAIAVPAAAGIPVTHRNVSRSFHVITAHTAGTSDNLPDFLPALARLDGTLVFLMGLQNLSRLAARLLEGGKAPDTPAAVCGAYTVRGPLKDIARLAAGMPPPAVILVGGTAGMNLWDGQGPLAGLQIGLTGTAAFRARCRCLFESLGAHTAVAQRSRAELLCLPERLEQALSPLPNWLTFTSPNGVELFFKLFYQTNLDIRQLAAVHMAAVGPRTAECLAHHGIHADAMPPVHDTRALGEILKKKAAGADVLLISAEQCSPVPQQALESAGIPVRRLVLYRTVTDAPVRDRSFDYLVFGSAGGVRSYYAGGALPPKRAMLCIGRVTATAAANHGRILVAEDTTPEALAQAALADHLTQESSQTHEGEVP